MELDILTQRLITLERKLHQPGIRSDASMLEDLLHPAFTEIGRSGKVYVRQEVIESLLQETERLEIVASNFKCSLLEDRVTLLTYESFTRDHVGNVTRQTLRSSIWKLNEKSGRWQMRFHQGTPAANSKGLIIPKS
ncbi:DUF4440 domain-containing protein [Rouxiella badensis]|jgi:hypothetical protein|uniref:DUF4440 domain-containing protein n=1 Tax=Rouxiella badensis TaxID=1646377 RepID=A0A1X0WGQ9_9GAMM|nr:DUF4440 domain-containing protein [Rouxiella badensis]MCC3701857.1 DUF4440 domain-containing protein [Rouxiella badensis]MCC3718014.1 DUF4440 domain-containing protein [Rouxiella badensis]MCC3727218.1 DUF4440 domain-containing protein [Rouxiella badensis]MCC3738433.1 DUF4440 domain-containing protein [Rouxiella badensis]MCC3748905.1 DUF4440 domain-containing protein [Rouxiella badensis]